MRLTERYCDLCRALADAGYVWQPRPGDWMLDITDESIGMLTTAVQKPDLVRRCNVQIPYGAQIAELLTRRGCREDAGASGAAPCGRGEDESVIWYDRTGKELYRCVRAAFDVNDDEERLAALVADYRRNGPDR